MKFGSVFVAENVYQASLPFHYLAKAFGLATYKLTKYGCDTYCSVVDYVIVGLVAVLWIVFGIFELIEAIESFSKPQSYSDSSFLSFVMKIEFIIQVVQALVMLLVNHTRRKHIQKMYQSFNEFDEKLNTENWIFKVNPSRLYFMAFVLFIVIEIILSFLLAAFDSYSVIEIGIFTYCNVLYIIVAGQFILSVVAAIKRMDVLFSNVR